MIRRMRASDREAFLRLTEEFYRSPAVAHDIPAARHAEMFEEIMRAEEYALGFTCCDNADDAAKRLYEQFSPEVLTNILCSSMLPGPVIISNGTGPQWKRMSLTASFRCG